MAIWKRDTYVKWFLEYNPSGFGLNFKVFHVLWIVWCRYWINNRTIIISIFIRSRHTQNICTNACILFYIFNVFLKIFRSWMKNERDKIRLEKLCGTRNEKKCHFSHVKNANKWFIIALLTWRSNNGGCCCDQPFNKLRAVSN